MYLKKPYVKIGLFPEEPLRWPQRNIYFFANGTLKVLPKYLSYLFFSVLAL